MPQRHQTLTPVLWLLLFFLWLWWLWLPLSSVAAAGAEPEEAPEGAADPVAVGVRKGGPGGGAQGAAHPLHQGVPRAQQRGRKRHRQLYAIAMRQLVVHTVHHTMPCDSGDAQGRLCERFLTACGCDVRAGLVLLQMSKFMDIFATMDKEKCVSTLPPGGTQNTELALTDDSVGWLSSCGVRVQEGLRHHGRVLRVRQGPWCSHALIHSLPPAVGLTWIC